MKSLHIPSSVLVMTHPLDSAIGALVALGALLAMTSGPALAHHRTPRVPYSMEILVNGKPMTQHDARGRKYVEALQGREYSIRLTNRTGERVAVALAVDGLNTIDAASTSARKARKWILGPWQTITLDGWQTSSSVARRFFFTTEESSYGAWLGKSSNLGLITAAVFREKPRPPIVGYSGLDSRGRMDQQESRRERDSAGAGERKAGKSRAKSAPAAAAEAGPGRDDFAPREEELAATGIGRETAHHVRRIAFDHEDRPASVLEVRYEFREALVRLGVLPRPLPHHGDSLDRRENARGFEDTGWAPDPYDSRKR